MRTTVPSSELHAGTVELASNIHESGVLHFSFNRQLIWRPQNAFASWN